MSARARRRAEVDVVVVGAGIVGLATAAALARRGRSVVVLERNAAVAQETSSRNSEVVHAGLYYPPGSLKARFCVEGREALYARCERLRVPHRRLGKIVVATNEAEVEVLEGIRRTGAENGVSDLALISGEETSRIEPAVRAVAALRSPSTGIVDAHALALSYAAEAESHDALLALRTEVVAIESGNGLHHVSVNDSDGRPATLSCVAVVNAAGLASDRIAALAGLDVDALGYRLHPCKGDYFSLAPSAPLRLGRLVYPVPAAAGLGVHATLDLAGGVRFGPDAEYVAEPRFAVDPAKAETFATAIRRYLPRIEAAWLSPAYAGVRPRLAGPGVAFRDFVVAEETAAGLPGFVNLIGIESPGLTAAHAIGERVASLLSSL